MKKNRTLNILLIVGLLLAAGLAGSLFFHKEGKAPRFRTEAITRGDLRAAVTATGTMNAVVTVLVGTQVSGTIKTLYVDFNSPVKKGQLLAQIDPATFNAQVEQARANLLAAQANVNKAEATLADAKRNFERNKTLFASDFIARSDLDTAQTNFETAAAQVAAARAQAAQAGAALDFAETNLRYTRIVSPVNGTVISRNVDVGQTVAASYQTPSIAAIARDLNQMQVEVNVDEADIGGVKEGQKAQFTVDTHPTEVFEGKVTQIRLSPTTSSNVVTYTVIVKVQNRNGMLMPGMTANVSLIVQEAQGVLVVPNSAFRFKPVDPSAKVDMPMGPGRGAGGGGRRLNVASDTVPTVYLLEKKAPVRTEVKKGITDGQRTEVLSGLSEGDTVITGIVVSAEGK